jgi:hypothetical protein
MILPSWTVGRHFMSSPATVWVIRALYRLLKETLKSRANHDFTWHFPISPHSCLVYTVCSVPFSCSNVSTVAREIWSTMAAQHPAWLLVWLFVKRNYLEEIYNPYFNSINCRLCGDANKIYQFILIQFNGPCLWYYPLARRLCQRRPQSFFS